MNVLAIAALAFAPGMFWLWFFYRKDRYEPESKRRIIQTFFAGIVAVVPAAILELIGEKLFALEDTLSLIVDTFFVIGISEEFFKFLAVYLWVYRKSDFNEPMDGIIYAASSSLGFASLENLLYIYGKPSLIVTRGIFSTLGHVLFSVFWGYSLGLAKAGIRGKGFILKGLLLAIFFHGLYDFLLFSKNAFLIILVIPLLLILYIITGSNVKKSLRSSPFKFKCPECEFINESGSSFCQMCGEKLDDG